MDDPSNLGYTLCVVLVLFACGLGLRNCLEIVKAKCSTISAGKAIGEGLSNVVYCVIGISFIMAYCTTTWQRVTASTVVIATAIYLIALLVYATTDHTCTKHLGIVMSCFHGLRCAVLLVAITAAL